MELVLKLRESSVRLASLENRLCSERAELIKFANASITNGNGSTSYFSYLSMVNKHNEIVKDYKSELAVFDGASQEIVYHHLHQSRNQSHSQNDNVPAGQLSVSSATSSIADIADLLIGSVAVPESFVGSHSNTQHDPTPPAPLTIPTPHTSNGTGHSHQSTGSHGLSAMSEPHQIDTLLSSFHRPQSSPSEAQNVNVRNGTNHGMNGNQLNGINAMNHNNLAMDGMNGMNVNGGNGMIRPLPPSNLITNQTLSQNQVNPPSKRRVRSATTSPLVVDHGISVHQNQNPNANGHRDSDRQSHSHPHGIGVGIGNGNGNNSNQTGNGMTASKSKPLLSTLSGSHSHSTKSTKVAPKIKTTSTMATKMGSKVSLNSKSLKGGNGHNNSHHHNHHGGNQQQQKHSKPPNRPQSTKSTASSNSKSSSNGGYKYGGTGYDVWRKNGQIALWTETELYCLKTFGKNGNDRAKLKRFLIKKGGFKPAAIKAIKPQSTKYPNNTFHFAFITVQDNLDEIKKCVARLNAMNEEAPSEIIRINRRKCSRGTTQCTVLFVTNFDILTKDDHRHFTDLFVQFGPLEKDVFMNRSSNGVNYAFVRFRKLEDALRCYHNQNDESWTAEPLYFNDRKLQIGFDEKGGRTQNR